MLKVPLEMTIYMVYLIQKKENEMDISMWQMGGLLVALCGVSWLADRLGWWQ